MMVGLGRILIVNLQSRHMLPSTTIHALIILQQWVFSWL
jgi:hypothetical protein